MPRALGVGYDVIDDALAGRLAIATLLTLAVGKLVIWWLALASGTSGGTLAPILIISSCTGGLIGELAHHLVPSLSPTSFALVAMAATFGAATRAPFAAIVFVFELTRDYNAILPLMLATVLAEIVTRMTLRDSLMTEKLSRRRVSVPGDYGPDVMANTRVGEIMTTTVQTVARRRVASARPGPRWSAAATAPARSSTPTAGASAWSPAPTCSPPSDGRNGPPWVNCSAAT